jgi:hypothetical protein
VLFAILQTAQQRVDGGRLVAARFVVDTQAEGRHDGIHLVYRPQRRDTMT